MEISVDWTTIKNILTSRSLNCSYLDVNNCYYIYAFDGHFQVQCTLQKDGGADQTDFETNYMPSGNRSPMIGETRTQFERTDIDLKIARGSADVSSVSGVGGVGIIYIQAVNERWTGGGYLKLDTYDIDDFVCLYIEDKDRNIAMELALANDPSATVPLDDSVIQGMGVIPGIGAALPNYPIVKSYTDDEQPSGNQGWYFDPIALGSTLPPMGECQIDPIGFYGYLPAGLYIKIVVTRPNVLTGKLRCDVFWGKSEGGV